MKTIALFSLFLFSVFCFAQKPLPNTPSAYYGVTAMTSDDSYIYSGGAIRVSGEKTNSPLVLSKTDGTIQYFPQTDGIARAIPDANGGWFIYGRFTKVGNYKRKGIAHVFENGEVNPSFDLDINGQISLMGLFENTLYIFGEFDTINQEYIKNIASINLQANTVNKEWIPNFTISRWFSLYEMIVEQDYIYLAGRYKLNDDTQYTNLSRISRVNGSIDTNWNPYPDGTVRTLVADADTLYIGGSFTQINGTPQNHLAKLNKQTGALIQNWNPTIQQGGINSIDLHEGYLYVGGGFIRDGDVYTPKTNLCRVSRNNGSKDYSWNPNVDIEIYDIVCADNHLFVAGTCNGNTVGLKLNSIFKLNLINGDTDPNWQTRLFADLLELTINKGKIFLAGYTYSTNSHGFNNLFRFNKETMQLDENWKPLIPDYPSCIISETNFIYIACSEDIFGTDYDDEVHPDSLQFIQDGIQSLLKVDKITGIIDPQWKPDIFGKIQTMVADDEAIYIGGLFSSNGNQPIRYLAKVNKITGLVDKSWNPEVKGAVRSLKIKNGNLYIGGDFTSIKGQEISYLARIKTANCQLDLSWNPKPSGKIFDILLQDTDVYFCGFFEKVNDSIRPIMAKVAQLDAKLNTEWNPDIIIPVYKLVSNQYSIFTLGFQGAERFNTTTGEISSNWSLKTNLKHYEENDENYSYFLTSLFDNEKVYMGGIFNIINDSIRWSLASFNLPPPVIRSQPQSVTTCENNKVKFEIDVDSDVEPLTFQWQVSTNNEEWFKLENETFSSLSFEKASLNLHSNSYRCLVRDLNGELVSNPATLEVYSEYKNEKSIVICKGETYNWQNKNYTETGTYFDTHQSQNHCDSIFMLNLTVNDSYEFVETKSLCNGETYNWQGKEYQTSGIYKMQFETTQGCDSTFILDLKVGQSYQDEEKLSICQGETLKWQGEKYTDTGTYLKSYSTANGCDSLFTLQLTVHPSYEFTELMEICTGESYNWRGKDYSDAGIYFNNLKTNTNCDSIYKLELIVKTVDNSISINGEELTATALNASFQWINCSNGEVIENETANIFSPLNSGNYAVMVAQNGCNLKSECVEVIIVSNKNFNSKQKIIVYPNPNNGIFHFQTNQDLKKAQIKILNIAGQTISNIEDFSGNHFSFDISTYNSGIYYLIIVQDEMISTNKIVKHNL